MIWRSTSRRRRAPTATGASRILLQCRFCFAGWNTASNISTHGYCFPSIRFPLPIRRPSDFSDPNRAFSLFQKPGLSQTHRSADDSGDHSDSLSGNLAMGASEFSGNARTLLPSKTLAAGDTAFIHRRRFWAFWPYRLPSAKDGDTLETADGATGFADAPWAFSSSSA